MNEVYDATSLGQLRWNRNWPRTSMMPNLFSTLSEFRSKTVGLLDQIIAEVSILSCSVPGAELGREFHPSFYGIAVR